MSRRASLAFLILGLVLGLLSVVGGVTVWVCVGRARPAVAEWVQNNRAMKPSASDLYGHSVVLLNSTRQILRDLPDLVAQIGKVIADADRLVRSGVGLAGLGAKALRGLDKALGKLLPDEVDLEATAGKVEATVAEVNRLMPEVKALQERLERVAAHAKPMSEALEAVGDALPRPTDAPLGWLDELRRDGQLLAAFDAARGAVAGLLMLLGLMAWVGAFAHLAGARATRPALATT